MKSGEELRELFTSPNALFIGVCEGWVKSEEYLAKFSATTYCCCILPQHTVTIPYRCTLSTLFLNAIAKVLNLQGVSNFSPLSRYAFPANGEKRKANGERNGEKEEYQREKEEYQGKYSEIREVIEKSEKITSFILPKHQISKNIRTFAGYIQPYILYA